MIKTALVHDWIVSLSGAEKVLEQIYKLYPSPIYTLVNDPKIIEHSIFNPNKIHSSFIQNCPMGLAKYPYYLPFFPYAIEQFDLSSYDLIISSSHCVAKGVITNVDQLHICYCHTPMRYIWDLYADYIQDIGGIKKWVFKSIAHYLRMWDLNSSFRVDAYIANSHFVARRIEKTYRREATVIYPPVDTGLFSFCPKKEDYYVTSSRLVPYKKMDMIVDAFSNLKDLKLVVIGDGPEMENIKKRSSKNIEILGHVPDKTLIAYLQKAKAFVFAAIEDFGILPVEAQSCGTPVIALKMGGVKESVIENKTGVFFDVQTKESLIEAVKRFEKLEFSPQVIREHALSFSIPRFQKEFSSFIHEKLQNFKQSQ